MKKLVIFDLDGTLLNTIADLAHSTNYALNKLGYPTHEIEKYNFMVGNGINKLFERALPEGEKTEENVLRIRKEFVPYYDQHNADKSRPYPGIPEMLDALKARGWKLGVVSNKADEPVKALIAHYFPGVFDSVVGERENVRKKPAPDSVFETVGSLGCDIGQAVYIGDSDVDGQTAVNAGCDCILVSWGFRGRETLLPFGCPIADSTGELLTILTEGEK